MFLASTLLILTSFPQPIDADSLPPQTSQQEIATDIAVAFPDNTNLMLAIATCESQMHQYTQGHVLHGKIDPDDTGLFQINSYWNGATAAKLGDDITTVKGNVAYAKYLYKAAGTAPWRASKFCWSKTT